jgi:hypothetical protein
VPGHPEVEIPYSDLRAYENAGDDEYKVVVENRPVKQSVHALLDGVDMPGRMLRFFQATLQVFISYSRKDQAFLEHFRGHLTPYERGRELEVWADPLIEPGADWMDEIFRNLDRAHIMILLVSMDSLASKFCIEKEVARAMERGIEVVPVLIRACRYDVDSPLRAIQGIRRSGNPVGKAKNDPAWVEVTKELDAVFDRVRRSVLAKSGFAVQP